MTSEGASVKTIENIGLGDVNAVYDALRILDFDVEGLAVVAGEFAFLQELAHAGKIAQDRFIARRR